MDKKNAKAVFLGFLVACAGAYAAYAAHDDDPRATEFAKYISDDIDALVAKHMTDEEIQRYIESYREHPKMFDWWIADLVHQSQVYNRELVKWAAAIHKLDSAAGRKIAFSEALQRIKELPDTSAHPTDAEMLQRVINAKQDADIHIASARLVKDLCPNE